MGGFTRAVLLLVLELALTAARATLIEIAPKSSDMYRLRELHGPLLLCIPLRYVGMNGSLPLGKSPSISRVTAF